jgi:serine/threonine protein kinase
MARVAVQDGRCLSEHGVMRLFAGALESTERGALDGHLAHCDRCAQLIAEAGRTTGAGSAGLSDRMRPAVLSPGMLVANRYHVRRLLGVGAMGEVHEVDDTLLGTIVALKTLNAKLAGDAGALKRLKREVAAARSVTHPNVCRIFDLGSDSGHEALGAFAFLTMEYLPGVTLTRYLTAHGPYAPPDALPLLIQLADGLAAAHAAGIVHRDLKAENIMMVEAKSGGFRALIMDFGLAGFDMPDEVGVGVEHGSGFSGTVAYAAPERIAGGRATPASDVYSFGLIAHEMLTNQRPIPGASKPKLAGGGALPPAWERFLARAIDVDPKARFATGGALAESLRGLGDAAKPVVWGRRQATALAAMAVVALAAVAGWTSRGRQEIPARPSDMPPAMAWRELTDPGPPPGRTAVGAPTPAPAVTPAAPAAVPPPPAARKRTVARRMLAASPPPAHGNVQPAPAARAIAEAPAKPPADDLVREVFFRPSRPAASDAAGDAELVDPFARRRVRADSTGSAP